MGPVPTHCAAVRRAVQCTVQSVRDISNHESPFELNISTPVTLIPGNIHTKFGFLHIFVLELGARKDRQTDGRTDGRARPVMRPIRTAARQALNKIRKTMDTAVSIVLQNSKIR